MSEHTKGPWAWYGNGKTQQLYLATTYGGRRHVMDFTRWGMHGAQPRFQVERGIVTNAADLLQFEVGERSVVGIDQAKANASVYRYDISDIKSADARLISCSAEVFEALVAVYPTLTDANAAMLAKRVIDKVRGDAS